MESIEPGYFTPDFDTTKYLLESLPDIEMGKLELKIRSVACATLSMLRSN